MIGLHHTHLMASDLDATIAFWRDGFGGEVVNDVEFAGARNVFLRVGSGRIHLYDQPPSTTDRGTVHHLGVVTDELEHVVEGLCALGHSVTDIRREPTAAYAMAEGPEPPARRDLPARPDHDRARAAGLLPRRAPCR